MERLDTDLKERDVYIESINHRLNNEFFNDGTKKAISYEEVKESPNAKQINNERLSKTSSMISREENLLASENLASSKSVTDQIEDPRLQNNKNNELLNQAELERLRVEFSSQEIRQIRNENEELNREICRLKEQLSHFSAVVEEVEKQRASNVELEREFSRIQNTHERDLEAVNSNYRSTICQKISEIQTIEQQLTKEVEKTTKLEAKLVLLKTELNELRVFKRGCELKDIESQCDRLQELENFKEECAKSCEENVNLKCRIDELMKQIESHKCQINSKSNKQCDQRQIIKNSVLELKQHYEEKAFMIKCYEEKIRALQAENGGLKCFRDKFFLGGGQNCDFKMIKCEDIILRKVANFGIESLNQEELNELHDRVKCALLQITSNNCYQTDEDYSKMIEDVRKKFNLNRKGDHQRNVFKDNDVDVCSTVTFPRTRRSTKRDLKKRSKSTDLMKTN